MNSIIRNTCFISALIAFCASAGSASILATSPAHPVASSVSIEVYLSDPNAGGVLLTTIGPINVTGYADADIVLDGANTGTLTFNSSELRLADHMQTVTIFGDTIDAVLLGLTIDIASSAIPVTATVWDIDADPPASLSLSIMQGLLILENGVGLLADANSTTNFGTDPVSLLLADLLGNGINGTTDDDAGLLSSEPEIDMELPAADVIVGQVDVLGTPFDVYARFIAEFHVATPEPATFAVLALSMATLTITYRRRRIR